MEHREERRPHDPNDERGGGGTAGGPGTDGQALWKKWAEAKKSGEEIEYHGDAFESVFRP